MFISVIQQSHDFLLKLQIHLLILWSKGSTLYQDYTRQAILSYPIRRCDSCSIFIVFFVLPYWKCGRESSDVPFIWDDMEEAIASHRTYKFIIELNYCLQTFYCDQITVLPIYALFLRWPASFWHIFFLSEMKVFMELIPSLLNREILARLMGMVDV